MAPPPFSRVNAIVSTHTPTVIEQSSLQGLRASHKSNVENQDDGPQTILFLSWSGGNPRHIEKYTAFYNEIWPRARIILVTSGTADFFYRTEQTSRRLVEPVVKMLSETTDESLLVHVMSNGGTKQWCTINKCYLQSTNRTLSNAVTIVDSAPGRSRFKQTWAALSGSLPKAFLLRMILGFIFGILLGLMHLRKLLLPGPDLLDVVRTQLNDRTAAGNGVPRSYIYSQRDEIIGWEDVEDHAKEAQQKGWAVELVKFDGSPHVGHMKRDPARYRETIEKAWKKVRVS